MPATCRALVAGLICKAQLPLTTHVQLPIDGPVVALAGGVGGAKLATGLYQLLGDGLTVVVNTGDDFEHWGLTICPDLDTVMYNLAGINNQEHGWGLADESYRCAGAGHALRR